MKRKILTYSLVGVFSLLASCSKNNPQDLAKEVCNCYRKMDKIANQTGRLEQLARCQTLQQSNMATLERVGVNKNWTDEQVKTARDQFDKIIENCSNK